jgi:hypothetical protein
MENDEMKISPRTCTHVFSVAKKTRFYVDTLDPVWPDVEKMLKKWRIGNVNGHFNLERTADIIEMNLVLGITGSYEPLDEEDQELVREAFARLT